MLKKTITYVDYEGVERKEDFYFNLSRAELLDLDLNQDGGMKAYLQEIIDAKDKVKIWNVFTKLVKLSYGVKTDDGKRFKKNPELTDAFVQSEAFSELMVELTSNENAAAAFANGILASVAKVREDK